jgi:hypothetical protein
MSLLKILNPHHNEKIVHLSTRFMKIPGKIFPGIFINLVENFESAP